MGPQTNLSDHSRGTVLAAAVAIAVTASSGSGIDLGAGFVGLSVAEPSSWFSCPGGHRSTLHGTLGHAGAVTPWCRQEVLYLPWNLEADDEDGWTTRIQQFFLFCFALPSRTPFSLSIFLVYPAVVSVSKSRWQCESRAEQMEGGPLRPSMILYGSVVVLESFPAFPPALGTSQE